MTLGQSARAEQDPGSQESVALPEQTVETMADESGQGWSDPSWPAGEWAVAPSAVEAGGLGLFTLRHRAAGSEVPLKG